MKFTKGYVLSADDNQFELVFINEFDCLVDVSW